MRKDQLHIKEEVAEYDKQREEYIEALGIKVLRFKNEEVVKRLNIVLDKIRTCLK